MEKNVENLVAARNVLSSQQRNLFLATVENINIGNRELLKNDLGHTFAVNIARDLAGEVARRYFDLGDFYITVDQLVDRFLNFKYDNDRDYLMNNEEVRKAIYNATDGADSKTMKNIINNCQGFQSQLFKEERDNDTRDIKGKKNYRNSRVENIREENGKLVGTLRDELTGKEVETTTKPQNKKDWYSRNLQADHKLPREAITYNERYIKSNEEILGKYKDFYNSASNMQMILASANGSKQDVRVCSVNGEIKYMSARSKDYDPSTDITMFATPEQLVAATVYQWENAGDSATASMKENDYLDKDGKVKPEVKEALLKQYEELIAARDQQLGDLEDFNYKNIAEDSVKETKKAFAKIVAGQLIYYVMPPVIFETQQIIRKKDMTLEKFFDELKKSGKRIIAYVKSKLADILINISGNSLHKFVKVFFDIVIEMAKSTVARMLKIIKDVVLSLVNCCKTIVNPKMTVAQKADAITRVMFTTVNAVVLEILFEYLEDTLHLPDVLTEPLQVIVTVISTNMIMLVLNELDLFDVKYGLLTSNIDKLFNEENERYIQESEKLLSAGYEATNAELGLIEAEISDIVYSIQMLDLQSDDSLEPLENINKLFSMGIDFEKEWRYFTREGLMVTV